MDDVISLVKQFSETARIFSLGIFKKIYIFFRDKSFLCCTIRFEKGLGRNASRDLLEGIARAGNGTALFASLEEGLGDNLIQQLRDALHPSWSSKWRYFKIKFIYD